MSDKLTFRTEIEFQGSPEELAGVLETINKLPVRLEVDRIPMPFPFPGGWPIPIYRAISNDRLAKLVKGKASFPEKILGGINGGIRGPHLHLDKQVVLIDKETFSKVVGNVAESIANELASETSYADTINALHGLNEAVTGSMR